MSKSKPLGDTEKTVLVGALILGGWLGIDALVKRAENRTTTESGTGSSTAMRRVRALRSRRRRGRAA